MATVRIFRINYKSDFILTLHSDAGWMTPFCIKFWTGAPSQAYYASFDGTDYTNCAAGEDPKDLTVQFDDHGLPIGDLKFQVAYHFTVADFPNDTEDEVINQANITTEIDGQTYQVMLDFNGETAPEIEFSLPAYANEAQRIENEQTRIANEETRVANEEQRVENEQARVEEYADLKADAVEATAAANDAAALANQEAQLADDAAALATQKAGIAQTAATDAENVNATLSGTTLTVTDRNGHSTSKDVEGPRGEQGIPGVAATIAVGTVTTGQAGSQASIVNVGTNNAAVLDFTIPKGDKGDQGIQGEPGNYTKPADGIPATDLAPEVGTIFDISVYNASGGVLATYANLTAALGTNGANVPEAIRKGGMSVRFVQSSDNKYVQYRLMANTFSTTVADWQGVDNVPTASSNNLVKSGGVYDALNTLDEQINGIPDEDIIVSVPTTAGTAISNATSYPCSLKAGKTYTLVYTGTCKNFNIYFRNTTDTDSAAVYRNEETSTRTNWAITPTTNTFTVKPAVDIGFVKFYTSASNVVNTETMQIEFTWHSDYVPMVVRIEQIGDALADKVDVSVGKNLFNKSNVITGVYIASNGGVVVDSSCATSNFIEIEESTAYHLSNKNNENVGNGKYINFCNSSKEVISTIADTKQFTSPSGAKYIRFTIINYATTLNDDIQLEKGAARTPYLAYNKVGGYLLEYESKRELEIDLEEKVSVKLGKNLYDASTKTDGKFFNTSGVLSSNSSYSVSDFIPVEASTTYCISDNADTYVGSTAACHVLYDLNKDKISVVTGDNKTLTTTAGTAYIRISTLATKTNIQVEKGSARTSYQVYSQIGGYPSIISDNSVGFSALKSEVVTAINNVAPISFKSLRGSATLAQNDVLYLAQNHVMKNSMLSAKIFGTISQVSVGVGYSTNVNFDNRSYQSHWVTLTATEVKLYNYYNNGWVLAQTYTHGMTLTDKTTIEVDSKIEASQVIMLRIYDDLGNIFQQTLPSWGMGRAFITNDGSASIDVQLSFMARDITHKVWLFGDSYMSFGSAERWPYYAMQAEFIKWLCNAQPGLSPDAAYEDLENMVTLGYMPSYLVWCLGMNGATTETQEEGQYVINSSQKAVIDAVVTLCGNYNITPVFSTVPTVPERQKTGFNNYVRSLGARYIDFAEAVGATSEGVWNTGLLSSDEVHPTAEGAKVLFSQILIDFPEISIVE